MRWLKKWWKKDSDLCILYCLIGAAGTALVLLLWKAFLWAIGGNE